MSTDMILALSADLVKIARQLALATDEGDDRANGTHYIARDGTIRCKGSFLDLIARARKVIDALDSES